LSKVYNIKEEITWLIRKIKESYFGYDHKTGKPIGKSLDIFGLKDYKIMLMQHPCFYPSIPKPTVNPGGKI
jgi:hypothetical protein